MGESDTALEDDDPGKLRRDPELMFCFYPGTRVRYECNRSNAVLGQRD